MNGDEYELSMRRRGQSPSKKNRAVRVLSFEVGVHFSASFQIAPLTPTGSAPVSENSGA